MRIRDDGDYVPLGQSQYIHTPALLDSCHATNAMQREGVAGESELAEEGWVGLEDREEWADRVVRVED